MNRSLRHDALLALSQNKMNPESILLRLQEEPILTLRDADENRWTFVRRHRCRRYLMAKLDGMKSYTEIYVSPCG